MSKASRLVNAIERLEKQLEVWQRGFERECRDWNSDPYRAARSTPAKHPTHRRIEEELAAAKQNLRRSLHV